MGLKNFENKLAKDLIDLYTRILNSNRTTKLQKEQSYLLYNKYISANTILHPSIIYAINNLYPIAYKSEQIKPPNKPEIKTIIKQLNENL